MKRLLLAYAGVAGLLSGCLSPHRPAPHPGLTYVGSSPVTIPASLIDHVLVVEAKWDKFGPYRFIIDTGSSVTLVSPALASRYAAQDSPPPDEPPVRVRSAEGGTALLSKVTLKRIQLGKARFDYVPALIYDCSDLSAQFGVPIDGILGFPLFRDAVLTLDYPNRTVVLRSRIPDDGLPGETILFNNADKTPLIPVHMGDREFAALIDSGSSAAMDINPAGLSPAFVYGPVVGPTVSTLAGDRTLKVGRLAGMVRVGSFDIPQPVAQVTDELSSLGGAILSHFTVTFDQEHDQVFLSHDPADSLASPPLRGTGLGFRKTPAYWKVVGVIPGSPGQAAGVVAGDLVTRINGEPVSAWKPDRLYDLMARDPSVELTFISGTSQVRRTVPIVDLVP